MHHLGIAILPEWSALAGIRSGQLENLLPDFSIAALPLHAVYPETHWMSLRARSFLDLLIMRSGAILNPVRQAVAVRAPQTATVGHDAVFLAIPE